MAVTPQVVPTQREVARFEGQGKLSTLPCWGWLPLQEGCIMDDAEALGLTGNNSLPRGMRPLTGLRQPGRKNSSHSTAPQLPHNPPLQVHLQLLPTLLLRVTTINMKYEGPLYCGVNSLE